MLDTLRAVQREGITPDELAQAQNKICSHVVLHSERPTNRLFALGENWLQRRRYQSVREIIESYRTVSRDDVARRAREIPADRSQHGGRGTLARTGSFPGRHHEETQPSWSARLSC